MKKKTSFIMVLPATLALSCGDRVVPIDKPVPITPASVGAAVASAPTSAPVLDPSTMRTVNPPAHPESLPAAGLSTLEQTISTNPPSTPTIKEPRTVKEPHVNPPSPKPPAKPPARIYTNPPH